MSGDEVQVIPEDLTGKASQIRGLSLSPATAQPALIAPDALVTSSVAMSNLAVNAEAMWAYQEFGRLEGLRLAQTLDNVAAAYAEVDRVSGEDIDSTMSGSGSPAAPNGELYPKRVDLPAAPHPPSMPVPKGELVSEQLLFPPDAQRALEAGDDGASLQAAAQAWRSNAESLAASAGQFETTSLLWEGEAADAAYAKFNAYREWLINLAGSWKRLAGEADRIVDAHSAAKRDNQPIAEDYARIQREIAQHPANADNLRKTVQMAALQNQSEEIRNRYARDGQPYQIQPEDPPSPVVSGIPVTVDDHRRARKPLPNERPNAGTAAGAARNSGSPAKGEPPSPSAPPAGSPISTAERAAQGAQQDSAQGGGSPGGGSQGGGQPGGGQSGAGMPTGPKVGPKLPTDPRLRPAATGGGGARAGGGGGATASPLQPAVGAETVAPTPLVASVVPAAAAGGAAAGAGTGGGMGGMAPMMHGAKGDAGGAGGDKKRNPQLSQDQEIYTEGRPWTEAVIGNRVRRRGAPDDTKKETQ